MPNKKNKTSKTDELVPIIFADSKDEAKECCQLLEDHGVKASTDVDNPEDNNSNAGGTVDEDNGETSADDVSHGIPVFVRKSSIDVANEIISERDDDLDAFALDNDELSDDEDDENFGMGPDTGDDNDLYDLENDLEGGLEEVL